MTGSGAAMHCDGIDSHCREKPLSDEDFQHNHLYSIPSSEGGDKASEVVEAGSLIGMGVVHGQM
jgi:hypothetical protein